MIDVQLMRILICMISLLYSILPLPLQYILFIHCLYCYLQLADYKRFTKVDCMLYAVILNVSNCIITCLLLILI